ncbi:hypothetical protein [Wenyingzhuangia fucanilytica]|nr:hypothetical protein [Wenyingzhuangia fucanilytica]
MKKVLLGMLFLATMGMFAQETEFKSPIKKGRVNLAGSLSVIIDDSNFENNNSKYKNVVFSPNIGYVIQENLVLGTTLSVGYGENKNDYENNNSNIFNKNTRKKYRIGVFAKKYIPVIDKLFLNLAPGVYYERNIYLYSNNNNDDNYSNQYEVNVTPGISYFFNNNLALQMNLGSLSYNYIERRDKESDEISSKGNTVALNLTSNVSLGISYFF